MTEDTRTQTPNASPQYVFSVHEHHQVDAGMYFAHDGPGDLPCKTACPAPRCLCGYFTLSWPHYDALRRDSTSANA